MQTVNIRKKELIIKNPNRLIVEDEKGAEPVLFVVQNASEIMNITSLSFYIQFRNSKGQFGFQVLDKEFDTDNDRLNLQWLPNEYATSEKGRLEIQIVGALSEINLTSDLKFMEGKLYLYKNEMDHYVPLTINKDGHTAPYIGQTITEYEQQAGIRVYEMELYTRWSTAKTALTLPENIKGNVPVSLPDTDYIEESIRQMQILLSEAETIVEDAIARARIPIQHVTNLGFMSRSTAMDILNGGAEGDN